MVKIEFNCTEELAFEIADILKRDASKKHDTAHYIRNTSPKRAEDLHKQADSLWAINKSIQRQAR